MVKKRRVSRAGKGREEEGERKRRRGKFWKERLGKGKKERKVKLRYLSYYQSH